MTAQELLVHQTQVRLADFIETVRNFPQDKLEWKPAPGARSALDQIQEVATIVDFGKTDYETRQLSVDTAAWPEYLEERSKLRDVDDLIRRIEVSTGKVVAQIGSTPDGELMQPFEMPWPVEFKVVDILGYMQWNLGYHAAQITYIASMMEEES